LLEEYRDDFELDINDALNDQGVQTANSINPYLNPEEQREPVSRASSSRNKTNSYFNDLDERKDIEHLLREDPEGGCLKNLAMGLISLVVIIGSFVASFYVGKKIFLADPIVKEEFANISVSKEIKDVKSKLRTVKNKLIIEPEIVAPNKEDSGLSTFEPTYRVQTNQPIDRSSTKEESPPLQPAVKKAASTQTTETAANIKYRVVAGTFSQRSYAEDAARNLKVDGFDTYIYAKGGRYRVQIGAFGRKQPAVNIMKKAISLGYSAFVAVD